jgi:hypothetical protein
MVGFCQLALARTGLEVESTRHQRAHSACYTATMACISANWQYSLSTPSTEGGGNLFRGVADMATV